MKSTIISGRCNCFSDKMKGRGFLNVSKAPFGKGDSLIVEMSRSDRGVCCLR